MPHEEFAKLFRDVKWPRTFEGKRSTRIVPTDPFEYMRKFRDSSITEDAMPPFSDGSLRSYEPTPREKLVDLISRKLFSDDRSGYERAEFLSRPIDVSPAAIPLAGYDTTRALGEGRYKDAILPGITSAAPFAGGLKKLIAEALERRGAAVRAIDDLTPGGGSDDPAQSVLQQTSNSVSKSKPSIPLYYAKGKGIGQDKTTDPYDIDFKVPAMPWERSSPWIAPYPPIPRPPRKFSLDYSKEALFDATGNLRKDVVDDAGNLLKDIEGRPLTAKYVVGRRRLGEKDRGLSTDDIYSILGKDLNAVIYPVHPKDLIRGNIAETEMHKPPHVRFWADLPTDQIDTTMAHELGHILEELGGRIESNGLEDELNLLYSELNTGRSGPPLYLPEMKGYSAYMAPREKGAEAFRAYGTDPNMIKTVAPKTAAKAREIVNSDPFLSKILQLNNIPFGAALGAGALATAGHEKETQANESRQQNGAQPTASRERNNLVQALMALKAQQRTPRYGGPR